MTISTQAAPATRVERVLAPDLVRGAMLLFIALANASNVAFASQPGLDPSPEGFGGRLLNVLMVVFVDARAYPVFAFMFGYGIVQFARRIENQGLDPRGPLIRRNAWLIAFGAIHASLLYFGDFLAAYGIVGLVATALLLRRASRFHWIIVGLWGFQTVYAVWLAWSTLCGLHSGDAILANRPIPSLAAATYLESMADRLAEWPLHTLTVLPFIIVVWLGMWAARRQLLERPDRRMLRPIAAICLAITFLGALPYALVAAEIVHLDAQSVDAVARLHAVSGEYGGPGYVALIALVAMRLSRSTWGVVAVAALGKNSLSGYLFQSVAWLALLSPLAWDVDVNSAIVAIGVWLTTVVAAWRIDAAGKRGPAETALRRLAYGRL